MPGRFYRFPWNKRGCRLVFGVALIGLLVSLPVSADECLSGDCQDGEGTGFTEEGKLYSGAWKGGLPHGRGRLTLTDGTVLQGEFSEGELLRKEDENERKGND